MTEHYYCCLVLLWLFRWPLLFYLDRIEAPACRQKRVTWNPAWNRRRNDQTFPKEADDGSEEQEASNHQGWRNYGKWSINSLCGLLRVSTQKKENKEHRRQVCFWKGPVFYGPLQNMIWMSKWVDTTFSIFNIVVVHPQGIFLKTITLHFAVRCPLSIWICSSTCSVTQVFLHHGMKCVIHAKNLHTTHEPPGRCRWWLVGELTEEEETSVDIYELG